MSFKSFMVDLRDDYRVHGSWRELAFWPVANRRFGRYVQGLPRPLEWLGSKLYGVNLKLIELATGIVLHRETQIGSGFHLVHAGNVKIHPRAVIGCGVGVMHDVTIGEDEQGNVPIIGDDVFIGAGAKVIGAVVVGREAYIAANSLVVSSVPQGMLAMGVPARALSAVKKRERTYD